MDRNLMQKFRKTLKMLEECRSVEDALKVLETVTDQAAASFILPVTQERVQEIVAEFERDLRQGRIPSTDLEKSLNEFLDKMKVASDESDSLCSSAESQTFQRQNSSEENETKMKAIFSKLGKTNVQEQAAASFILPVTQERVQEIEAEFERDLRQGRIPSTELEKSLNKSLVKMKVSSDESDSSRSNAESQTFQRQNSSEENETKMKAIFSKLGKTNVQVPADIIEDAVTSPQTEENSASAPQVSIRDQSELTCTETEDDFEDLQLKYSMPKLKPLRLIRNEKSLKRTIPTICVEFQPYNWYLIDRVNEFLLLSLHAKFAHASWIKEVQDAGGNLNVKHRNVCKMFCGMLNCHCGVDLNCKVVGKVGFVTRAVYHTGQHEDPNDIKSNPTSGVEVVLIKMVQPLIATPLCLPASIYNQWKDLGLPQALHFKGKVLEYMECPLDLPVYKIGKKTGLTIGKVESKNGRYSLMDGNLTLENQLKIRWENEPFSEEGDSGSFVFCVKKEQEICSVGILTGSDSRTFSVVTPMSEILNYLSGNYHDYRLKEFMYEEVDGRLIFRVTDRISRK